MAGVNPKEHTGVGCNVSNRGHKRIVGVQAKLGTRSLSNGGFQFIQSVRNLTIAVQLVAKDISKNNDLRRYIVQNKLQRGFVTLNYSDLFLGDTIPYCVYDIRSNNTRLKICP